MGKTIRRIKATLLEKGGTGCGPQRKATKGF
jgi:hypothetical protein